MSNDQYMRFLELKHGRTGLNGSVAEWQRQEIRRERWDAVAEELAVWSMMGLIGLVLVAAVMGAAGLL